MSRNFNICIDCIFRLYFLYVPVLKMLYFHGRINHLGAHTNVRRGPFSHTGDQDFLSGACLRVHFSPNKLTTFFFLLVVVTFKPRVQPLTLNVQTLKQRGKKLVVDRAPWRRGPPPMVQPAQWLIRPCLAFWDFFGIFAAILYINRICGWKRPYKECADDIVKQS